MENCDEKHIRNNMKIQNENLNLTSIKQEQLNTHDQSCQLTTNENDAYFGCQPKEANFKTENIDEEYHLTEEIYIKEEPLVDGFTSNNSDEESKEFEELNSTSSDSETNDQPKQEDRKKGLYKFVECDKASSTLERHRRIHSGARPFQCDVSNKSFKQKDNLKLHKRSHDNNQLYARKNPYHCSVCSKTFRDSCNFTRHMRIHTGEKPFQCSVCSKTFIQNSHLTAHMRTHTGKKPYQCHICQYKSSDSSNLKTHIRSHTGEKPYQCHLCQYKSSISSNLTSHIRSHVLKTMPYL